MRRRSGERIWGAIAFAVVLVQGTLAQAQPAPDAQPPPAYPPPAAVPPPAYPGQPPGYPPAQQYPPQWQYAPYPPPGQTAAPEATERRFGDRGQMVLTGGFGSVTSADGFTDISLSPSIDFFAANHFSIGGGVLVTYLKNQGLSAFQEQGLLFHLGFDIPLGGRVSLWPRLVSGFIGRKQGPNYVTSELQLPLLVHVAPHFFFGVGPFVGGFRFLDEGSVNSSTSMRRGLTSFIGGWL